MMMMMILQHALIDRVIFLIRCHNLKMVAMTSTRLTTAYAAASAGRLPVQACVMSVACCMLYSSWSIVNS